MPGPDFVYSTTAARLAATFTINDIGKIIQDLEDSSIRMVLASGSGATVMTHSFTTARLGQIPINIYDWREVSSGGDVGAIAANGGVLASDTTPIMRGDAAESAEISWATGDVDPISTSLALPTDFDGSQACYLDLEVSSGTTNAASFVVETGWDGGALVSDTSTDTATKSATRHWVVTTIAAADVPDSARTLTIALTPPTHATDAIQLHGAILRYAKK